MFIVSIVFCGRAVRIECAGSWRQVGPKFYTGAIFAIFPAVLLPTNEKKGARLVPQLRTGVTGECSPSAQTLCLSESAFGCPGGDQVLFSGKMFSSPLQDFGGSDLDAPMGDCPQGVMDKSYAIVITATYQSLGLAN